LGWPPTVLLLFPALGVVRPARRGLAFPRGWSVGGTRRRALKAYFPQSSRRSRLDKPMRCPDTSIIAPRHAEPNGLQWRGLVFFGVALAQRVVVFIDWQHVYKGAQDAFHRDRGERASGRSGNVDPILLGERLAQSSSGRERQLGGVRIYRGQPDLARDPRGYAANWRQRLAWEGAGVTVVQRPLRYPKAWPAERALEKGIDVVLAVDFVTMGVAGEYDVGILMSTDTDLKPALEAIVKLGGNRQPRCEVAAWTARRSAPRLRIAQANLWCHYLRREDYLPMVDTRDYTVP